MKKLFLVLLIIGQNICAQNTKKQDSTKNNTLETVFITASRTNTTRKETPVAINKITEKTIDEAKANALYEIINKTPGVLMTNLGNEQHMMSIRQPITTNSYFLYLEDGIPIRPLGIFNHNALLEINQFNLESIEVIKGPASSLYGPEAVGGTINLISLKPSLNPEFKIGIQADQWGYRRLQASASATIGKVGLHLSGISSIQENSWLAQSDYTKDNINARIDYKINTKTRLISNTMYGKYFSDTSSNLNENDFNNRTYSSTSDFTFRKSDALRTRLTLEHDWNTNASSYLTVYHRNNKLGQNPAYAIRWSPVNRPTTATGEVNSNDFKSYGVISQHTQKFDYWKTTLVSGATFDFSPVTYWSYLLDIKATLNPGETGKQTVNKYEIVAERPDIKLANYTANIYNTAVFNQVSFSPIQKTIITIGGRYDAMSINYNNALDSSTGTKDYDKFTFKAGINFNPIKETGFYGNYSQGFAPPGITSIFRARAGTGGVTGKPAEFYYNLEPATFENFEIGGWVNVFKNKFNFDYAIYYLEGNNELLNVRLEDNSTDFRSAGKTRHKGVEFGFNYKPNSQWNIRIGGTVAEHRYIDFKLSDKSTDVLQNLGGFEMPQAPRWSGNSEVTYYPKWLPNFRAAIEHQYISSYYQDQINTVKYEGYNLFNARVGYKIKGIEIYGNIMNLTDKLYANNVSRGNQPSAQSNYIAAAPRTFLLGLQYNFSLKK